MSGYGKDASPLTSQTTADKRAYLDERAKRLNWSRAEVVANLVDFWFAMGAPALSELDALAPVMEIPKEAREPLRPYWQSLVPFEAVDDRPTTAKVKKAEVSAAAVMKHARAHANRAAGKQVRGAQPHPPSGQR